MAKDSTAIWKQSDIIAAGEAKADLRGTRWTQDQMAQARALYESGKTAAQVAAAIGGVSRNAVLGLAFRKGWLRKGLGLTLTVKPRKKADVKKVTLAAAKNVPSTASLKPVGGRGFVVAVAEPAPPVEPLPADVPAVAPDSSGKKFFELRDGHCRFPLWPHASRPPTAEAQFYCGRPTKSETSSWCADCAKRVHAPYTAPQKAPRPSHARI